MHKISDRAFKFQLIILFLLLFGLASFGLVKLYDHYRFHIMVKFTESGPLYKDMPVFYKGGLIGRTQKVILSSDYKYTLLKILLYPTDPKIPGDVVGSVKQHDILGDYIDLVTPDEPSTTLLANNAIIEGKPIFDLGAFLSDIADSGLIIPLIQNFSDTLVSANETSVEIKNFFSDSRIILQDNRQNLKQTTKNLSMATKSLKKLTTKFNKATPADKLNNTTSNIDKSADNIQAATESVKNIMRGVDCATVNLDKTIAKIDSTISEANIVASNVRAITSGLCEALSKRFAGLRIIFGKPMDKNKCPKNCSK